MGRQKGTEGNRIQRPSEETQGTSESCRRTRVKSKGEGQWEAEGMPLLPGKIYLSLVPIEQSTPYLLVTHHVWVF